MFLPPIYTQVIIIKVQEGCVLITRLIELYMLYSFFCQAYLNKMLKTSKQNIKALKISRILLLFDVNHGDILILIFLDTFNALTHLWCSGRGRLLWQGVCILILCPADMLAILASGVLWVRSLPCLHPPFNFSLWVDMWVLWDTVRSPQFSRHTP